MRTALTGAAAAISASKRYSCWSVMRHQLKRFRTAIESKLDSLIGADTTGSESDFKFYD